MAQIGAGITVGAGGTEITQNFNYYQSRFGL